MEDNIIIIIIICIFCCCIFSIVGLYLQSKTANTPASTTTSTTASQASTTISTTASQVAASQATASQVAASQATASQVAASQATASQVAASQVAASQLAAWVQTPGFNYAGNDISPAYTGNIEMCKNRCINTPNCVGALYDITNGNCWPKSSLVRSEANNGLILLTPQNNIG